MPQLILLVLILQPYQVYRRCHTQGTSRSRCPLDCTRTSGNGPAGCGGGHASRATLRVTRRTIEATTAAGRIVLSALCLDRILTGMKHGSSAFTIAGSLVIGRGLGPPLSKAGREPAAMYEVLQLVRRYQHGCPSPIPQDSVGQSLTCWATACRSHRGQAYSQIRLP
jgi:hypothetical protein